MNITQAEILEALRTALPQATADGFTVAELAAELGVGPSRGGEILRQLARAGKVQHAGYRPSTGVTGQPTKTPVYRLISG